jgi:hypothetical protein
VANVYDCFESATPVEREGKGVYFEVFECTTSESDCVVGDVDQEIAVACADAAVAAYDFRALVVERCGRHVVCKGAAVAGCFVSLGWGLGVGHDICVDMGLLPTRNTVWREGFGIVQTESLI